MSDQPAAEAAPEDMGRIVEIELDTGRLVRWSPEVEHERKVAIYDLLERNRFALLPGPAGPYRVDLSLRDNNLIFAVTPLAGGDGRELGLAVRPLRKVIKDYFLVCESYYQAIRAASPQKIEAIDMGRRGLHNEGSQMLMDGLKGRVSLDLDTARRLFTLMCVLHIRG